MKGSPTNITTPQFLGGIRHHDSVVLQAIFTEYFPRIEHYVLHNHGSMQDAEDLFMDALEALYRQVTQKGLEDLSCSFYTYLYEICKRLWYKKLRKEKPKIRVTKEEFMVFKDDEDIQEALEDTERHSLYWEKFRLLGDDCQQVLNLSVYEQKSSEEVAQAMGYKSAGYARKKKSVCKDQLETLIEADRRYDELRFP